MAEPPSKRRRMPETEQQFMKIELFTMAGETVQSLLVPSTIHGRELLDLVLPAQAQIGSVPKLLHGVSAINKSVPISAQGITDCARLTLLRMPISEQRRKAVVCKITTGFPYELSEEEDDALNSITELKWGAPCLDHVTLPSGLQSLTFDDGFNHSLDNTVLPSCLRNLTFGWCFNQSLDNTALPTGLQSLEFGGNFDQSLDNTALPSGLQSLRFRRY